MQNVQITKATLENLKDIQTLNQLLFIKEKHDYTPEFNEKWPFEESGEKYFIKLLTEPNYVVFVSKIDGKIVGYLAASSKNESIFEGNPVTCEIENIFILDEYRNVGIGSKLMEAFKQWALSKGAKRATVIVNHQNPEAIGYYKKHGFNDYLFELKLNF